jgi:putative SOS response-associated peptidase YedK
MPYPHGMCGRFTLTKKDFQELALLLGVEAPAKYEELYRPRYNIAPTDQHWIVRSRYEQHELLPARWGLVNSWSRDGKSSFRQINCRAESALKSRAFRDAAVRRRCVVPADGFFEWTGTKDARRPTWFHSPHGDLLLLAGLYESWTDAESAERTRTFTILTTGANALVARVHDRMPVILPRDRVDEWMHVPAQAAESAAERLIASLGPADEGALAATEVSRRVNSVANDDPSCLASADDREDDAQLAML